MCYVSMMIALQRTGIGTPLVLIHGITESRRAWDPLLAPLAEAHDVVAVDLRGHGESAAVEPFDLITMATDVHEVVDSIGVGAPVVVGHSLGGAVATAYAAMFDCRGVIDIDQPLRLGDFQAVLRSMEPALRGDEATFRQTMDMMVSSLRGSLTDPQWDRLQTLRGADQRVVLAIWSVVLDSPREELDQMVANMASAVKAPYLSLHGQDPGPDYEAWLTAHVPTAMVEVWDGLGHYPHLAQPDRFVERVNSFERSLVP